MISDLSQSAPTCVAEKFKDVIQSVRNRYGTQDFFSNAEFLAQEMQKIFDARSS